MRHHIFGSEFVTSSYSTVCVDAQYWHILMSHFVGNVAISILFISMQQCRKDYKQRHHQFFWEKAEEVFSAKVESQKVTLSY